MLQNYCRKTVLNNWEQFAKLADFPLICASSFLGIFKQDLHRPARLTTI